jgi:hypothetical protein
MIIYNYMKNTFLFLISLLLIIICLFLTLLIEILPEGI